MYEYSFRVGLEDSDYDGRMTIYAMMECFQKAFYNELDELNIGKRYFMGRDLGWFIHFWQVDIDQYPINCNEILIGTFSYENRGSIAKRNFYIKTNEDRIIVKAHSIWSLVYLPQLKIIRIPDEVRNISVGTKLEMDYQSRRIRYDKDLESIAIGNHIVNTYEIDSNRHLNNARFVKIGFDALGKAKVPEIKRICVEYKKQAVLGDTIYIFLLKGNDCYLDLKDELGESFATIRMEMM